MLIPYRPTTMASATASNGPPSRLPATSITIGSVNVALDTNHVVTCTEPGHHHPPVALGAGNKITVTTTSAVIELTPGGITITSIPRPLVSSSPIDVEDITRRTRWWTRWRTRRPYTARLRQHNHAPLSSEVSSMLYVWAALQWGEPNRVWPLTKPSWRIDPSVGILWVSHPEMLVEFKMRWQGSVETDTF